MSENKLRPRKANLKIEAAQCAYARSKRRRFQQALLFIGLALFLLVTYFVFKFWGRDVIEFITDPVQVREFVAANPVTSRLFFITITFIRVVLAFLPGEPVEIGAGYAFGSIEGAIISLIGILLASIVIFKTVRRYGRPVVELFFTPEQIDSVKFLKQPKDATIITLIVFLIPGTPKDILTYLAGLTTMSMKSWIFITTIGRFPSVITSTIGGGLLNSEKYLQAIIVFGITFLFALVGLIIYRRINKNLEENVGEG